MNVKIIYLIFFPLAVLTLLVSIQTIMADTFFHVLLVSERMQQLEKEMIR